VTQPDAHTVARRHKARAEAALELGRFSVAERDARAALSAVPEDVDALLFLSRALLGQSRTDEAEREARAAVERAPRDGYTHYLLGFVLQVAGRHGDAVAPLREAVSLQPSARRYHARLSIALCESGLEAEARTVIDAVATLGSEDPLFVDECARVYSALREHDASERFALRALALRPADPAGHWRLAWVLANKKQFARSAEYATSALALDPNYWAAWEELGYALYELRTDGDAEAALAEALRLKPGLRSAAFNLVALYRRNGRVHRAERVCDEALAADPRHEQLARVRDSVRAERIALERERRSRCVSLVGLLVFSTASALMARQWPTAALSLAFAIGAAIALYFAVRTAGERDDGPAPSPRLGAREADGAEVEGAAR
jgi:tetratricopeptide (TPR) repeat protein